MTFWTAVVIIVVASCGFDALVKLKKQSGRSKQDSATVDALLDRMDRLEERMANLETLVLEDAKERRFAEGLMAADEEPPKEQAV